MTTSPGPVTADDVVDAVAAAISALRVASPVGWSGNAGDLTWTCWETMEHTADDLFFYAAQLGAGDVPGYLPIEATSRQPSGPENSIRVDRAAKVGGLFDVLTAMAALLAAMVRVTPSTVRAHHGSGPADPEASAAMGVLETVVHTFDVASSLGVPWTPDDALCARVLGRLLSDIEPADTAWNTLLWACGRISLPGRPRRKEWDWDNQVRIARPSREIGLVTLVVPNYDDAIDFYVHKLGFALLEDTDLGDGKRWVRVAPPGLGAALLLAQAEGEAQQSRIGDQTGGRVALFLYTSDFETDHAAMLTAGVEFLEEPRHEPFGTVAVFTDPFGNKWDFIENK